MTSECFSLSKSNPLAYQMVTHPLYPPPQGRGNFEVVASNGGGILRLPLAREGEIICLPSLAREGES
ncbi:hypothetical protein [Helicobacter macacae]|uniref:hypothetical protein n=1 Tax=Helicobacter macacae TaxID=398626 RepID=UPI00040621B5|nr:hypothetical protein [Helicobacter macacae]